MKVRALFGLLMGCGCGAWPLAAQSYVLANGRVLDAKAVTLKDGILSRTIVDAEGTAEVGVPASAVVRLQWPQPVALLDARVALERGEGERAGQLAEEVMREFEPWAALPGAWWSEAAWLRARAWLLVGQVEASAEVARTLAGRAGEVTMRQRARLLVASGDLASGRIEAADALWRSLMADGVAAVVEPEAQLVRGQIALARGHGEEAVEAFLQVPVFFPRRDDLLPEALLGSARGYAQQGELRRARQSAEALVRRFSESRAASLARKEFLENQSKTTSP